MEHNHEFVKIQPEKRANKVLEIIESVFAPYWFQHGLIHESVFDEVFCNDQDIDTLNQPREGKPLNDLATNRQRFMMDNHDCRIAEITRREEIEAELAAAKERKKAAKEAADAERPEKVRECCQPGCVNLIDITTNALKRSNEKIWKKCDGKGSRFWCCPDHVHVIDLHETNCKRISVVKI
jgi:hypothetical protein